MGKIWETTVATCRKHLGNIWEIMRECLKQKVIRIWDMLRHFLWTSGIEIYWDVLIHVFGVEGASSIELITSVHQQVAILGYRVSLIFGAHRMHQTRKRSTSRQWKSMFQPSDVLVPQEIISLVEKCTNIPLDTGKCTNLFDENCKTYHVSTTHSTINTTCTTCT